MRTGWTIFVLGAAILPLSAKAQVMVAPPPYYASPYYAPPPYYVPPPPHVYLRQLVRWHLHRPVRVAAPPPVYYAPAPPPVVLEGPVYATPAAPVLPPLPPPLLAPAPEIYDVPAAPRNVETVVVRSVPAAPWAARVGLGARMTGLAASDSWDTLGFGGELLYRASPHLVTELAAEYQQTSQSGISRHDVPITFGLRLHLGPPAWIVSPFLVAAAGIDLATEDFRVAQDHAFFVEGQIGGGIEVRLGSHFAVVADARLEARKRASDPTAAVLATQSVNGKAVHPLDDQVGMQFRLGAAVYF